MPTIPALRTLTAALFTSGILAAVPIGTAMAAVPSSSDGSDGSDRSDGSGVRGTVVSAGELNLREQPTTDSPVVGSLSPGSHGRVECAVTGQTVRGNPHWYWLPGVDAWASAVFIDTGGRSVPSCSDPCPEWKDDGHGHDHGQWSASGTWSFSWNVTFG
ncbi:SH3 domain-containing protein [Streptomyces sp. SID12501]|uniref:SH3 domain-containing protein n=1 Tax=Streptomyces sp. SID12501 TaxID=2706042 RepID=A0A6B3BL17_9ACTN|nr:SH3 domain-containing protein [Streptomyces sp. SID12501]NEC84669.1 SH3 domain-containing protein [Streptomyces sp. SID12501]